METQILHSRNCITPASDRVLRGLWSHVRGHPKLSGPVHAESSTAHPPVLLLLPVHVSTFDICAKLDQHPCRYQWNRSRSVTRRCGTVDTQFITLSGTIPRKSGFEFRLRHATTSCDGWASHDFVLTVTLFGGIDGAVHSQQIPRASVRWRHILLRCGHDFRRCGHHGAFQQNITAAPRPANRQLHIQHTSTF